MPEPVAPSPPPSPPSEAAAELTPGQKWRLEQDKRKTEEFEQMKRRYPGWAKEVERRQSQTNLS